MNQRPRRRVAPGNIATWRCRSSSPAAITSALGQQRDHPLGDPRGLQPLQASLQVFYAKGEAAP